VNDKVGAFTHLDQADVLAQADASDARRRAGQGRGPLEGIPVAIKDNIAVKGQPLTCSSKMLAPLVSPYDSTSPSASARPARSSRPPEHGRVRDGVFHGELRAPQDVRSLGTSPASRAALPAAAHATSRPAW
jgi:hypothetical protein